jgi:hypothetical protein
LEVGNKFFRAVAPLQKGFAVLQLFGDRQATVARAEAAIVTVNAAASGDAAVAVGAGKSRID